MKAVIEVLTDLRPALIQLLFAWVGSGLLFSLVFHPIIMGPYRWARFRYFNLPRKLIVWVKRSWPVLLLWPFEMPRLVQSMSRRSYDKDLPYQLPTCRFIGHLHSHVSTRRFTGIEVEYFFQIGDTYIRGKGARFYFCKSEDVVFEMMTNPKWRPPREIDKYIAPSSISDPNVTSALAGNA